MVGEAAHHLGRVLRAQKGQLYELSDGALVRLARVESVARDRVEFELLEELPGYKPRVETTLLLSIVKFDAFEWALEKGTELGVSRIVPLAISGAYRPSTPEPGTTTAMVFPCRVTSIDSPRSTRANMALGL